MLLTSSQVYHLCPLTQLDHTTYTSMAMACIVCTSLVLSNLLLSTFWSHKKDFTLLQNGIVVANNYVISITKVHLLPKIHGYVTQQKSPKCPKYQPIVYVVNLSI